MPKNNYLSRTHSDSYITETISLQMELATMNASPPPTSPSSSATTSPPTREGDAIRQYDSDSDKPASSIELDEKRSIRRSSSESTTSRLLTPRELEEQPEPIVVPAEDLVPRRTKIIFVTIYFFLNLALTLSNKSVLSHVSALLFFICPGGLRSRIYTCSSNG
jgi:hypothetical protein